jgi:enoyl-CoA hydratase/carnithine racemase
LAERTVHREQDGRVLTVRLDNPPHNFMTGAMVVELLDLARSLEGDDSVGAVIVTGAPEDLFVTHYDVEEIRRGSEGVGQPVSAAVAGASLRAVGAVERIPRVGQALRGTPAAGLVALREIHELWVRFSRLDKVIIAAINGTAVGGGCELALACDIRLMARGDHLIGLPEVTLGIMPGAGGTQRLTRLLSTGRALEMILEGRIVDADEAERMGLIHRAIDPARLAEEARAVAERMARRSPLSVAGVKRAVYEGSSRSLPEGLRLERAAFMATTSTPPALRAMDAYLRQLEETGDAPWKSDELRAKWQEGIAVDLTDG